MQYKFELTNVAEEDGAFRGEVRVNGTFVCQEWGTDAESLQQNFAVSKDVYLMLYIEQYEVDCG